ncbi:hypothetical protein [Paenibacillus wenxiniae]|uniref:Uncharacterized protein n=1 Tax=Paenibacillus wenxiniae TaxID=1636843 RepID=A0ABW4RE48_9BACL
MTQSQDQHQQQDNRVQQKPLQAEHKRYGRKSLQPRRRRFLRRLLGSLLVFGLLAAVAIAWLAWMIAPERDPGLTHNHIDLKAKIIQMVEQRKLETTLTPAEFNDLATAELLDRANHFPPGITVTGAAFSWQGEVVQADVRGSLWGIPFGGLLDFDAVRDGNELVLTHRHTTVKHGSFNWPHLEPIRISLNKYMPAVAKVSDLTFGTGQITLTFKLDLWKIPRLLWR